MAFLYAKINILRKKSENSNLIASKMKYLGISQTKEGEEHPKFKT